MNIHSNPSLSVGLQWSLNFRGPPLTPIKMVIESYCSLGSNLWAGSSPANMMVSIASSGTISQEGHNLKVSVITTLVVDVFDIIKGSCHEV